MNDILQYKNYYASVHFSAVDEVFYGKILSINDLVSFEGFSVKELKKAFEEAVEDYLETCIEIGKIPEKTYKGTFNVRVPRADALKSEKIAGFSQFVLKERKTIGG